MMQLGMRNMTQSENFQYFNLGEQFSRNLPQTEFPSQKSKCVNNFCTDEDRRKFSTDHLQEIRVGESSGDVISGLERRLAAELTCFANYTKTITRRRKMSLDNL
jgi:hypothetical protein